MKKHCVNRWQVGTAKHNRVFIVNTYLHVILLHSLAACLSSGISSPKYAERNNTERGLSIADDLALQRSTECTSLAGHSSQRNITQHGMLPLHPTGTTKLICDYF